MKFYIIFFLLIFSNQVNSQILQSINHNGVDRVYFYYTPSDYLPNQQLPGTINMDLYSPQVIWDFLAPKSCSTSGLFEENLSLEMYPNPVEQQLTIQATLTEGIIVVTDFTGKVIVEKSLCSDEQVIDLEGLDSGIYLLAVYSKKGRQIIESQVFVKK